MAYETGSVTIASTGGSGGAYNTLIDIMKNFLVANGWTLMREQTVQTTEKEIILESSTYRDKKCYIGIRTVKSSDYPQYYHVQGQNSFIGNHHGIIFNCYTGYTNGTFSGNTNPAFVNGTPDYGFPGFFTYESNSQTVSYHMYTNGKCFIFCNANSWNLLSGNFYIGFFKPYATNVEHEYPLLITHCMNDGTNNMQSFPFFALNAIGGNGKTFLTSSSWILNNQIQATNINKVNFTGMGITVNGGSYGMYSKGKLLVVLQKILLYVTNSSTVDNNRLYGECFGCLVTLNKYVIRDTDTVTVNTKKYVRVYQICSTMPKECFLLSKD